MANPSDYTKYDVFLIHTGAQRSVEVSAMKDYFEADSLSSSSRQQQQHMPSLNCFLDQQSIDMGGGSPNQQMEEALETCRHAVAVISHEFLAKKDPKRELQYAFYKLKWIRSHKTFAYEALWVVLLDMDVADYKGAQRVEPDELPDLANEVTMLTFFRDGRGRHVTWRHFCNELKAQIVKHDRETALESWDKLWKAKKKKKMSGFSSFPNPVGLYDRSSRSKRRVTLPPLSSALDLLHVLPGTTWKKPNDLEQIIFETNGRFFNNLAGHPTWRQNSYSVDDATEAQTEGRNETYAFYLTWSVDDFKTPCILNPDRRSFFEIKNPYNGRWELVATKPYVPPWGC